MGLFITTFVVLCFYILFDVNYFIRHVILIILYKLKWRHNRLPLQAADSVWAISRLSDMDHNWHMNNVRYLRAFEYGRSSFVLKNGLREAASKLNAMLPVSAVAVRYRRPVGLFQRYKIFSKIVFCQGRDFYIEQRLVTNHDNFVRTTCLTKLTMTSGTCNDILEDLNVPPSAFADAPPDVQQFVAYNTLNSESLNPNKGK